MGIPVQRVERRVGLQSIFNPAQRALVDAGFFRHLRQTQPRLFTFLFKFCQSHTHFNVLPLLEWPVVPAAG